MGDKRFVYNAADLRFEMENTMRLTSLCLILTFATLLGCSQQPPPPTVTPIPRNSDPPKIVLPIGALGNGHYSGAHGGYFSRAQVQTWFETFFAKPQELQGRVFLHADEGVDAAELAELVQMAVNARDKAGSSVKIEVELRTQRTKEGEFYTVKCVVE